MFRNIFAALSAVVRGAREFVHARVMWRHVAATVAVCVLVPLAWFGRPESLTSRQELPPGLPEWFVFATAGCVVIIGGFASAVTRLMVRLLIPVTSNGARPLPSPRLPILGRLWPRAVTGAFTTMFAIATAIIFAVYSSRHPLTLLPVLFWAALYPMGVILIWLECRGKNETDRVLGHILLPSVTRFGYDAAGIQSRLARYAEFVSYYEVNGLDDPSPAVYTERQCEKFREAFEEALEQIAVWEQELERVEVAV